VLTPGNKKLGGRLVWGFGLPSGRPDLCVGLSADCVQHCYALRVEGLRPAVLARYEKNLRLTRRPDFARRVRSFILAHDIAVVRVHTGGDFYDAVYAGKWLQAMRRLPAVRFFFYTRSWRDVTVCPVLEQMALLPNCRAWYSCDRGTGVPAQVPARVRLAWLMTAADDLPPHGLDLAFRIRPLRRQPLTRANGVRVCPAEDGVVRRAPVTCDRCRLCWRPLPPDTGNRIALPLPGQPSPWWPPCSTRAVRAAVSRARETDQREPAVSAGSEPIERSRGTGPTRSGRVRSVQTNGARGPARSCPHCRRGERPGQATTAKRTLAQ
jgi:hypothetical protein